MEHIAIMKKSWGLLPKILSGQKTIESRWYKNKSAPWGKIKAGETVYFKNSGEPVTVKAVVKKVEEIDNLSQVRVRQLLEKYGQKDGIEDVDRYHRLFADKKYCLLVYLDKVEEIEPFDIDKKGFGAMAAWICTGNVSRIKVR